MVSETALKAQYGAVLLGMKGVHAVGEDPDANTLVVYVEQGTASGLELPDGLSDDDVKVIETGQIKSLATMAGEGDVSSPKRTGRVRPVPIGVSVGHVDITAGTSSFILVDDSEVWYSLSNNHIYADMNDAEPGDTIVQPGPHDGGRAPDDKSAALTGYVPIEDGADADAAWAETTAEHTLELVEVADAPQGNPYDPSVEDTVLNTGRTTGVSRGKVTAVHADARINYGDRIITLTDQIITTKMAEGGDSGSAMVTAEDYRPVGLTFAGSDTITIHNYITNILDHSGLGIVTEGDGGDEPPATHFTAELVPSGGDGEKTGTITGEVLDAESGGPVEGAYVELKHADTGDTYKGTTNADGWVSWTEMPLGTYAITVTADGYDDWTGEVTLG